MAAVDLHLNVTYARHLALKSFYEKSQSVMGGNFFSSYSTMFELRDSKASDLNCLYEALVQKKTLIICHDRVFTSFLCVLSSSLWFNITGSFACKINHFVQSKPQVIKALMIEWQKSIWTNNAFLPVLLRRTFVQKFIPIKNTALPERSKRAGIAFLVKTENKILLKAIKIL